MNNRVSSLSFISDRTIGTKVSAGFAVVLLILAVSSALAWLAFGRASGAVADYTRLVANSAIFRDIDLGVTQYRGHVREYVFSNDEATAATAVKDGQALRQLIASGLAKVTNPERHRLLEDAAKQADTYAANFERIRAMNLEQGKLEADVLDPVGQQMTDGFTAIITGANKAGIPDLLPLAIEGRRLSLMARLDVNKRLGRHDEAAAKSAAQTFEELRHTLAQIDSATKGTDVNAPAAAETKLIDTYQAGFTRAASLDTDQIALVNGAMVQAGAALAEDAVKAKDSNLADQAATETAAQSVTGNGETLVMWLGLAGLAAGAVLAWLIGRGISRPVVGMCAAMRALAGGDKTVEIPGIGRKDEIGQMADTVAVFKNNMIEADRLRDETERHKAEAEKERKAGMLRLADNFEAGIKGVVNSVASQATEMQSVRAGDDADGGAGDASGDRGGRLGRAGVGQCADRRVLRRGTVGVGARDRPAGGALLEDRQPGGDRGGQDQCDRRGACQDGAAHRRRGAVDRDDRRQTNLLALNATIEAARAGRCRQGVRGRRQRGQVARQPDREGDRGDQGADRRNPGRDRPDRGGDPQHRLRRSAR